MGIVRPQTVMTCVTSQNYKYYESLGYNIPYKRPKKKDFVSRGKEWVLDRYKYIWVDVDDLFKHSNVLVTVQCENCGKYRKIHMSSVTDRRFDNETLCPQCTMLTKFSGENNYNWNPNLTEEERIQGRHYQEYYDFVKAVYKRDNYTCQCCGTYGDGKNLIAHHLDGYGWCKEKRTDVSNGITLCSNCHKNFHSLYGNANNTKEQFEEWIGYRLSNLELNQSIDVLPSVYCIEDNVIYEDRFKCAKQLNCNAMTIWSLCHGKLNTYHGKHYVYYDNYLKMTQEEIDQILNKPSKSYRPDKRVVNLEFGFMNETPKLSAQYIEYKYTENIINCCNHNQKHAGKYKNVFLSWMWCTEFEELSSTDQLKIIENNLKTIESNSYLANKYNELISLNKSA